MAASAVMRAFWQRYFVPHIAGQLGPFTQSTSLYPPACVTYALWGIISPILSLQLS